MSEKQLTLQSKVSLPMLYMTGDADKAALKLLFFKSGKTKILSSVDHFGSHVNERKPVGLAYFDGDLYMLGKSTNELYTVAVPPGAGKHVSIFRGTIGSANLAMCLHKKKLYYVTDFHSQLAVVDELRSGHTSFIQNDTRDGFGVNEKQPRGLASFKGSLYMVGRYNRKLYELNTSNGDAKKVTSDDIECFGLDKDTFFPITMFTYLGGLYLVGECGLVYALNHKSGKVKGSAVLDLSLHIGKFKHLALCEVLIEEKLENILMRCY